MSKALDFTFTAKVHMTGEIAYIAAAKPNKELRDDIYNELLRSLQYEMVMEAGDHVEIINLEVENG